jgi:hypothetical protein
VGEEETTLGEIRLKISKDGGRIQSTGSLRYPHADRGDRIAATKLRGVLTCAASSYRGLRRTCCQSPKLLEISASLSESVLIQADSHGGGLKLSTYIIRCDTPSSRHTHTYTISFTYMRRRRVWSNNVRPRKHRMHEQQKKTEAQCSHSGGTQLLLTPPTSQAFLAFKVLPCIQSLDICLEFNRRCPATFGTGTPSGPRLLRIRTRRLGF